MLQVLLIRICFNKECAICRLNPLFQLNFELPKILSITLTDKQVDIPISKNQVLQILYLKHCVYNNETT